MNEEQAFLALASRIKSFSKNAKDITRADVDEISVLKDNCRSLLSEKFVSVVEGFDRNFSIAHSPKIEFIERLVRILAITEEFPPSREVLTQSDELLPSFSLKASEKSKVLGLCTEMRKIVFSSDYFDEPHKRRLLNRIAAIEQQVHQKRGLFDVVRGGINDLGETLNKFGRDIEPLTKRMQEVVQITRDATKEYDQLPAPDKIKKLAPPAKDE